MTNEELKEHNQNLVDAGISLTIRISDAELAATDQYHDVDQIFMGILRAKGGPITGAFMHRMMHNWTVKRTRDEVSFETAYTFEKKV